MNHIRVRKWVCYDWYFEAWQARVASTTKAEEHPCLFEDSYMKPNGEHGSKCGFYRVSIEDIEDVTPVK